MYSVTENPITANCPASGRLGSGIGYGNTQTGMARLENFTRAPMTHSRYCEFQARDCFVILHVEIGQDTRELRLSPYSRDYVVVPAGAPLTVRASASIYYAVDEHTGISYPSGFPSGGSPPITKASVRMIESDITPRMDWVSSFTLGPVSGAAYQTDGQFGAVDITLHPVGYANALYVDSPSAGVRCDVAPDCVAALNAPLRHATSEGLIMVPRMGYVRLSDDGTQTSFVRSFSWVRVTPGNVAR
jgi:hypothetical protein